MQHGLFPFPGFCHPPSLGLLVNTSSGLDLLPRGCSNGGQGCFNMCEQRGEQVSMGSLHPRLLAGVRSLCVSFLHILAAWGRLGGSGSHH